MQSLNSLRWKECCYKDILNSPISFFGPAAMWRSWMTEQGSGRTLTWGMHNETGRDVVFIVSGGYHIQTVVINAYLWRDGMIYRLLL